MTVGLFDGTKNRGLAGGNNNNNVCTTLVSNPGAYGNNTGVNVGINGTYAANYTIGITTDPTKSGIEVKTSNNIGYIIKF